jgi:hypothetical protein
MNNYEKIKKMSIDEMAEYLEEGNFTFHCNGVSNYDCYKQTCETCCKKWLEQEATK